LASKGLKVVQVGCDPKHDSTRLLLDGKEQKTLLDCMRNESMQVSDAAIEGKNGILCLEAGGPEPGIGCAGRGILTAFNFIRENNIINDDTDVVLYDVLGDVVCGGFAVPLRHKYADCVFLVTSGEFMAIYAANNVLIGIKNFDGEMARVAGIIFNGRGGEDEYTNVKNFADSVGLPIIGQIPRSNLFRTAESKGVTLSELEPDSLEAHIFEGISEHIKDLMSGKAKLYPARPLGDQEIQMIAKGEKVLDSKGRSSCRKLALNERETLRGCGAAVAAGCCWNIRDMDVILHAPASCSYYFRGGHDRGIVLDRRFEDRADCRRMTCTNLDEFSSIFGGN